MAARNRKSHSKTSSNSKKTHRQSPSTSSPSSSRPSPSSKVGHNRNHHHKHVDDASSGRHAQVQSSQSMPITHKPQATIDVIDNNVNMTSVSQSSSSLPQCQPRLPTDYSWDTQNMTSFLTLRSKMLSALFDTRNVRRLSSRNNNNGSHNDYVRSQSVSGVKATAAASPQNKVEYTRAQSVGFLLNQSQHALDSSGGEYGVSNQISDLLPKQEGYFAKTVWLLFDTPLPLVGKGSSNNKNNNNNIDDAPDMIQLRQPQKNETSYLIPRKYLRDWIHWARNSVVNNSIQRWLFQLNDGRNSQRGLGGQHTPEDSNKFLLDDDALRTLAALSIMADQYQLWDEREEGKNWTQWFHTMETSWKGWVEKHGRKQHPSMVLQTHDEKKNDEEGITAVSDSDVFHFLPLCPPGPVDCRILSSFGHPLQLRRNVSLMMKGVAATANASNDFEEHVVLSVDEETKDDSLIEFLSLDDNYEAKAKIHGQDEDTRPRIGICPVSSSFYEWIRSTLGVICEDDASVSFQPGSKSATQIGNCGGDSCELPALLYHEQSSNIFSFSGIKSSNDIDIPHPASTTCQSSYKETVSNSHCQAPLARPIEFPRRILSTTIPKSGMNDGNNSHNPLMNANKKMSSYSKLMKEAMTRRDEEGQNVIDESESKSCTVEVYPVEFRYVVVDPTLPSYTSPAMSKTDRGPSTSFAQGVALVSRVSRISDALNDLKRAVELHRSSACVRLWGKSPCAGTETMRGATIRGDGYDLIDETLLDASTEEEGSTVEAWLRLDEKSREPFVVEILVEIRSSPTSRWVREPFELQNRLQVGDFVDAQDTALKWYEAIVRELTPETVKVHYFGWGSRWDGELPRRKGMGTKNISPPMPLWTKTSRWRDRINIGVEVEVRQTASLLHRPKWYRATVIAIGRESDSPRELLGGAELEMIEDESGKQFPLKLLQRKRQVMVRVPQERNNCPTPAPVELKKDNGIPIVHPPYIRWVDLYGEEICEANTHISSQKQTDAPATVTYAMDSQRKQPVEVMKSFNNLHGAGFVRESLRGMPPAPGSVGLHNLGNSCYMNSILQCINHINPITQYFLKGDYIKDVNKNNPLGSGGRVATAYASFLNEIWTGEYSILAPRLLKQIVGLFAPQFNNNYQHDSQEFCQYLMDGLHEDLNRVKEKPYVEHVEAFGMKDDEAALESWKKHLQRHDSIFVDYTQGMHRSHLTCPSCGKESVKYDVFSSISLPLVPSKDRPYIPLKDCIDQFAAGEQLDEHNAWYCSRCKKHVCALKLITLWNTPDILVLHLKRFTFEKCPTHDGRLLKRKIEDKVDFPIDKLDLSSYVLGPKYADAPPIYKVR
eukprot:CCRYP_011647-RC/>CCRYP_011647-RC protein AED:0.05 eAED:0.05 QI:124/1/1/1/1/1/6/1079/1337